MVSEDILASLRASVDAVTEPKHFDSSREVIMKLRDYLQRDPAGAHAVLECVIRHDCAEADDATLMRNQMAIDCVRMLLPRYAGQLGALDAIDLLRADVTKNDQLESGYFTALTDLVNALPAPRAWREIVWYIGMSQHPLVNGRAAVVKWATRSEDALGGAMRHLPPVLKGAKDIRRSALDAAYATDQAYATACSVTDDPLELYSLMRTKNRDPEDNCAQLPEFTS